MRWKLLAHVRLAYELFCRSQQAVSSLGEIPESWVAYSPPTAKSSQNDIQRREGKGKENANKKVWSRKWVDDVCDSFSLKYFHAWRKASEGSRPEA